MLKWFLTGPDKPRIQDKAVVKKMYHTARVQAVTAMILGYGMYYVMRMTLGVAKKPMLQDGFTPTELGMMGAGMLVAIAIGKCATASSQIIAISRKSCRSACSARLSSMPSSV